MNDVSTNHIKIVYGKRTVDWDQLPATSKQAMASRGITHYLGNEQNAKLTNWKQKQFVEMWAKEKGEAPSDETIASAKAQDKNFGISDETIAAQFEIFCDEAYAKLMSGEVGVRSVNAIVVDPVEKIVNRLAKADVMTILAANGLKAPKGDEAITFANGTKRTMAEMIAKRIELKGDEFTKAANREIATKNKALAAAKASSVADDLGL